MRYRFPTKKEITDHATELSRLSWGSAKVHTKFLPKESGMTIHVGEGVFLSRCGICGEYFLNPGASSRPANLAYHLFEMHNIYDGYEKPAFAIDGILF